MKIYKNYLVFFSLFLFLANSCTEEFEPIFDKSASERINLALSNYDEVLKSATNGWKLAYFPGDKQEYGGYNFYLKFSDEGKVEANDEVSKKGVVSDYSLKQEGGAILSIDTFNEILHEYANPSAARYRAKRGDFEFLVLKYQNDTLYLKGRKTGNLMTMVKVKDSKDAYNDKVLKVRRYLDRLNLPLGGTVNGQEALLTSRGDRTYDLLFKENGEVEEVNISYIYTDKGVSFYKPIEVGGKEYSELIFDEVGKKLKSEDGAIEINLSYVLINFKTTKWNLEIAEEANRSEKVKKAWDGDNLLNGLVLGNKFDLHTHYTIGNDEGKVGFFSYLTQVETQQSFSLGGFGLDFSADETDENLIHIKKLKPYSLDWYYGYVNNVLDIITQNSPYTLELNDDIVPTRVKLTSKKDPEVWFYLDKL